MRYYELTYLISSNLPEKEAKVLQEKISALILESQGALGETKELVKKKLEYPIRKQGAAYLAILNFHLNPEMVENLEKKLKSENQILNFIILIKKPEKITEISKKISVSPISQESFKSSEKSKKVELKEIEKKLEEILGE